MEEETIIHIYDLLLYVFAKWHAVSIPECNYLDLCHKASYDQQTVFSVCNT